MNREDLKSLAKKEWRFSSLERISEILNHFSVTEKAIFFFFAVVMTISGVLLLYKVNENFLVEVPDYGGSLTEGVIGSPRFINPILSNSDVDKDLTALVYSGLLKSDSKGQLINDLAEYYEISEDGLTYTVGLKDDIFFHDGTKITADDVVFTIERVQDPELKSPREVNWMGVKIQKIDERTVNFILKQQFSPFLHNLTLGILPKHIWRTASPSEFPFSQFNTNPIGSGPYMVDSIKYTDSGIPSEYHLKSFRKYSLRRPYIENVTIKSYPNEKEMIKEWKSKKIDGFYGISPKQLADLNAEVGQVILTPLSRVFGVFFNQNSAQVLSNKEVRLALNTAIDRASIINEVLAGYGLAIDGPIPKKIQEEENSNASSTDSRIERAKNILIRNGWKQNDSGIFEKKDKKTTQTLSFSISTGDAPELKESAILLQKQWTEMGALVDLKIFEIGDLNQNIIKPRKYDALLFGEIIGKDNDLYSFWHSSQRNSPGLNIALYTNLKADRLLENIRKTTNTESQKNYFDSLIGEIKNDIPAVFTYSPHFIYIVTPKVKNIDLDVLTNPSERFNEIEKWYIETNNVWKIFIKD